MEVLLTEHSIQLEKLKWLRDYYQIVHEMTETLNQIFGWSHLHAVLFCFYYILTSINWAYLHFFDGPSYIILRMLIFLSISRYHLFITIFNKTISVYVVSQLNSILIAYELFRSAVKSTKLVITFK